jgi:tetratricopeptide (TPR) repeat protein
MDRRRQLDASGRASSGPALIRSGPILAAIFLIVLCVRVPAQSDTSSSALQQSFENQNWQEVLRLFEVTHAHTAGDYYYYGGALARLGRYGPAEQALLAGLRQRPADKRFPLELAGVAFRRKRYSEATHWLHRALELDPADDYANDFLGSTYFLADNLEAALKYWNRIAKPEIQEVRIQSPLQIRPALLDTALAFSPAEVFTAAELRASQLRVRGLGIFSRYSFDLAARNDGKFDLAFHAQELNGIGDTKLEAGISFLRGIFYQTVYPEYFNIAGTATNFQSLVRWDPEKRRVLASLSGPLRNNAKRRYGLGLDLRNENWSIRDSFTGPAPVLGALNLRRESGRAEITSSEGGRTAWTAGVELSHRDLRNLVPGSALTSTILLQGFQLKQYLRAKYDLWRVPERRFVLNTDGSSELARIWSNPAQAFAKLQGSASGHWFPQFRGDDYETLVRVRGGKTFGDIPFDELFMLGLERDNELWMRAHIGTREGRKGSAPLGRNYFLASAETDKNVYGSGIFRVKLGPFLDTGTITDPVSGLGSPRWLVDIGAQAKFRVLGVGVVLSYGKDLRSGNNAFYTTVSR